jgi:hypothetical protein
MPVYKEGLKGYVAGELLSKYFLELTRFSVIIPTVTSLLAAVKQYEDQGGTASIYVNDDGMQLVKPDLAEYVLLSHPRTSDCVQD